MNRYGKARLIGYAIGIPLVALIGIWMLRPRKTFTGYPPSLYMGVFQPCSSDNPCTRTQDFQVDSVPKGCCILTATNGNGLGKETVSSFEVLLNGKSVISSGRTQLAATVPMQISNTIQVVLTGEPSSKLFVLIAYDPRQDLK